MNVYSRIYNLMKKGMRVIKCHGEQFVFENFVAVERLLLRQHGLDEGLRFLVASAAIAVWRNNATSC